MAGDRNLDFGTGALPAPQAEFSTDFKRAFPHSEETGMSGAKGVAMDATAVVADHNAELMRQVFNFNFDAGGLGMTERVARRFGSNAVDLLLDKGMNEARSAAHEDAKAHARGAREFVT